MFAPRVAKATTATGAVRQLTPKRSTGATRAADTDMRSLRSQGSVPALHRPSLLRLAVLPAPESLAGAVQRELTMNDANDPLEHEADRIAGDVMRLPAAADPPASVSPRIGTSDEKFRTIENKSTGTPDLPGSVHDALRSPGLPLDASSRAYFEPRFGHDFSRVRVHSGPTAESSARVMNAQAYTVGNDVVFGAGGLAPHTHDGRQLLAHELVHVVQQSGGSGANAGGGADLHGVSARAGAVIQRKLLVRNKPDAKRIRALLDLLGPASGLTLTFDSKTEAVSISGSVAQPTSPALSIGLEEIIEDPSQDSELEVGGPRAGLSFGAFPMSPPLIQVIDLDDLVRLETRAPGSGVALLFHEIVENYRAHAGDDLDVSHEAGLEAERQVAGQLVRPGARVAEAVVDKGHNIVRWVRDYESYFLVYDRDTAANILVNAWQSPRVNVGTFSVDGFAHGSDAVPAGAQAAIDATANAMRMNSAATVRIDCGGQNSHLALRRAERVQDAILDSGRQRKLYGFDFRSENNFNLTATGEANERAVITVDQPDIEVAQARGKLVERTMGGHAKPPAPTAGLPDWRPRR